VVLFGRSSERTPEDLELIFEELSEQKALAHLPNSVKRELASVVVFEAHPKSGHTRKYNTLLVRKAHYNILYYDMEGR